MQESDAFTVIRGVSEPLLAIVVQGKKEVLLNEETFQYGVAQYLVLSVDLPVSGCVIEASPKQPFLGFKLNLDPVQLCDIITQTNPGTDQKESVRGWGSARISDDIKATIERLRLEKIPLAGIASSLPISERWWQRSVKACDAVVPQPVEVQPKPQRRLTVQMDELWSFVDDQGHEQGV